MAMKSAKITANVTSKRDQQKTSRKKTPAFVTAKPSGELLQQALTQPERMDRQTILSLQHTAGNQVVTDLLTQANQKNTDSEKGPMPNRTGLPDGLKAGIESISGLSLDQVHVHYNSSSPARLRAFAYTEGTEIHLSPGQERHLPHEAWHVVQQMQGRVKPNLQLKEGVPVNDNKRLEQEATVMGEKALQIKSRMSNKIIALPARGGIAQFQAIIDHRAKQIQGIEGAMGKIEEGNDMATPKEILIHDGALSSGQHHGVRNITKNALRSDLSRRIEELQSFQERDQGKLQGLSGKKATQL
jgi:hypothetical protein